MTGTATPKSNDNGEPAVDCPPDCDRCALRKSDAFAPVDAKQLDYIEKLRKDVTLFKAGSELTPENKKATALYTLYSGWAFRYKTLTDGRRQILNFLLPGDFIGLQEQFADGPSHGVEALTDITVCVFPRDNLWQLYRDYPQLAYDVTWLAAREESHIDENLLSAGRRNATERIAMLLLHLYRRARRVTVNDGPGVQFPLTQQHIADALGLSLVHTNKTLRKLLKLGLHRIEGDQLEILNPKALQRIADYYDRPLRQVPLI